MSDPTTDKSLGEQAYEQFADRYAQRVGTKAHNAHYDRPGTLSLLPEVAGTRVLDAGAGSGEYSAELLDRGAEVVACDVTPRFVELLEERFAGRVDVHHADLRKPLGFAADASFDGVVCALVLSYLPDWEVVMAEFARVLKPGGWAVISTAHPFGDWTLIQRLQPGGTYFEREQFGMAWSGFSKPRPVVSSYRRSLMDTLNPLLHAGLVLEHLHEPRPTAEFEAENPQQYAKLCREPAFMMLRARKPG